MKKFKFFIKDEQSANRAPHSDILVNHNRRLKARVMAIVAALCLSIPLFSSSGQLGAPQNKNKALAAASDYAAATDFTNAVILVSFEGETTFPENFSSTINDMYNDSDISVKSYFKAQTNSCVNLRTLIAGGGKFYKLQKSAQTYKPRYGNWKSDEQCYEEINHLGYDNRYYDENGNVVSPDTEGAVPCGERILLEQRFVRDVIELAGNELTNDLFYSDYGGKAQSLSIITDAGEKKGGANEYGEILWWHKSSCLSYKKLFGSDAGSGISSNYYFSSELKRKYSDLSDVYLGLGKISGYTVMSAGELTARKTGDYNPNLQDEDKELYDIGRVSHELMHSLDIGEYYSISNPDHESVGEFDVMASPCVIPQYSLSYVREKQGWLSYDDFLYINKSGNYTLYPVGSDDSADENVLSACKIVLSNYSQNGEYFMAEVRNNEGLSGNRLFDSCLSGKGLIIYRVNESAAYTNEKGDKGTRDYCNAYDDEVFVFRKENEKNGLNDPLLGAFSFALLGVENKTNSAIETANDYSRFGTKKAQADEDDEIIYFSDGTNSGIVFENIVINSDGSVSFDVYLPENDSDLPVLNDSSIKLTSFYDGSLRLYWNTSAKSGSAYVLILRATDRLKRKAESGELAVPAENVKNGSYAGYKTLYHKKLPLAEKKVTLPEFSDDALIFFAVETNNSQLCTRYAGALEQNDLSLKQYLVKVFDPFYIALSGSALLITTAIVIILLIKNKPRKLYEKKDK